MRATNIVVFDEHIATASSPAYTSESLNTTLGSFDQLAIMAVVDDVTGANSGFKIVVEHSPDGRNWLPKSGGTLASPTCPEIGGGAPAKTNPLVTLGSGQTAYFGHDPGTTPSLGHVRFKVDLGTTTSAHVRIHVTGRNLGGGAGGRAR